MSDQPSGTADLISDVEEHIKKREAELAEMKRDLENRRGHAVVLDEDGNEVVPGTAVAVTDDGNRELDWKYLECEYKGETFNVRKPQPQALAAFSIVASRYIKEQTKADIIGLFVKNHMSPLSFLRFAERMMDPDDPEFDQSSMGEMMRLIATGGTSRPTGPSRA